MLTYTIYIQQQSSIRLDELNEHFLKLAINMYNSKFAKLSYSFLVEEGVLKMSYGISEPNRRR